MTTRERLARAAYQAAKTPDADEWEDCNEHSRETSGWYEVVDAILKELREPSGGMVRDAVDAAGREGTDLHPQRYWQIMIDAILEGKG